MQHDGLGFASAARWTASFASISELTSALSGKCAAHWSDPVVAHCDSNDAAAGFIWHPPLAPDASLVRVPILEPGTCAPMLAGPGLLGDAARRHQRV